MIFALTSVGSWATTTLKASSGLSLMIREATISHGTASVTAASGRASRLAGARPLGGTNGRAMTGARTTHSRMHKPATVRRK